MQVCTAFLNNVLKCFIFSKAFEDIFGGTFGFTEKSVRTSISDLKQERDRLYPKRYKCAEKWAAFISFKYRPPSRKREAAETDICVDLDQRPPASKFAKFKTQTGLLVNEKLTNELVSSNEKVQELKEQNRNLQIKTDELQKKLKQLEKSKSVRVKNQTIKRKDQAIAKWKNKYFALHKKFRDKQNFNTNDCKNVENSAKSERRKLNQRLQTMKHRGRIQNKENSMLKAINDSMEIWDIKFDCNLSEQVKSLNSRIKELEQEVATARLVKSDVMCNNPKVKQTKVGNAYMLHIPYATVSGSC